MSHTERETIVNMLIENGADVNHKDANDETPLIRAANAGKRG